MYDDVVTIYNMIKDVGYRTVIKGVHLEPNTGVALEGTGMKENDTMLLIIPVDAPNKKYVDWKTFKGLSENERSNYFTLKAGDKIVEGELDFEITNVSPNTLANLERNNVNCFTMSNYALKKMTGSKLNHFEVTGR